MSSSATAPSRSDHSNQQPRLLADPYHLSSLDDLHSESPTAASQTMDQASRVERLLTQLEARSVALVPYGFANVNGTAPKSNNGWITVALIAIWVGTIVLGVAYMRYSSHSPQTVERAFHPLIIPAASDVQDQKVAQSVDRLATALIASSERLNALEAEIERSNHDPHTAPKTIDRPKPLAAAAPKIEAPSKPAIVEPIEAAIPKSWHRVLDITPTDTAVSHKTPDGSIDYWLVPRGAGSQQTKVLPIGTSSEGVIVHSLEDGNDYTLTSAGEWRNGAIAVPRN